MSTFCPENKATTALMQLESDRYYLLDSNLTHLTTQAG
jgi:hypothetical protein